MRTSIASLALVALIAVSGCSKGTQGPAGAQGPAGPAGPQGAKGEMGAAGAAGPQGPAGPQGAKGEIGAAGPAGPQGPAGPAGPLGPKGDAGAAGAAGPQGPKGETGAAGPAGPPGVGSVVQSRQRSGQGDMRRRRNHDQRLLLGRGRHVAYRWDRRRELRRPRKQRDRRRLREALSGKTRGRGDNSRSPLGCTLSARRARTRARRGFAGDAIAGLRSRAPDRRKRIQVPVCGFSTAWAPSSVLFSIPRGVAKRSARG